MRVDPVITRQQARTESWQKVAVKTLTGDDLVGTFKLPSGLKNGKTIRISKSRLEERLPGDHAWPDDGVKVRVRVPDWRLRNGVVALFVLAGVIAGAWHYATLLVAIWGIIALSARHNRLHAVDRFDPAVPRRFWSVFCDTLASTAMLYLVPIGAVIAFYLAVAAVFRFVDGVLTVHQLETAQGALSVVSEFVTWIKLEEGPMLLALVGVWLLTCLLLAWRGRGTVYADSPGGRLRRMRYGLARALNRTAGAYSRYSGPVAATLVTLASFTFLTNVPSNLGTQLRLEAVARTVDYTYAAEKIEADLTAQVVSQLYTQIKNAMPTDYKQAPTVPLPVQVARTRQQVDRLVVPLQESNPVAAQGLATEERRIQNVQNLPDQSVVDGARASDPVNVPHDLTAGQAAAAREQAESDHSEDRVEIINDSGKEVLLQLEKVASEQGWTRLKNLVSSRFPLAAPMIDALAEACDEQLQETLREKIPALVKQLTNKASDIKSSIAAAAKDIVATVNVSNLVRNHATDASHLAAGQQTTLAYLKDMEDQLKLRADIVQRLTWNDGEFDSNINRVLGSSDQSLRTGVVDDLRKKCRLPTARTRTRTPSGATRPGRSTSSVEITCR